MGGKKNLPKILKKISLDDLERIDVALEGDWSPTVATVWSRERGLKGFSRITRSHERYKPSLELYFGDTWVGIHCFKRVDNQNVFDEEFALRVIGYVESIAGNLHQRKGEG